MSSIASLHKNLKVAQSLHRAVLRCVKTPRTMFLNPGPEGKPAMHVLVSPLLDAHISGFEPSINEPISYVRLAGI